MIGRILVLLAELALAGPAFAQSALPKTTPAQAAPVQTVPQSSLSQPTPSVPQTVTAIAYDTLPGGAGIETQVNDDTELNQDALTRVNSGLQQRGYQVEPGAPYVMVIDANLVRGDKQDNPLGQITANNNEAKIQSKLFSTTQNSLLNPKRPIGSADRLFRINLSIYERASGLYVWRGSANRNDPNLVVDQASDEMVAALLAHIGQTVEAPKP